MPSFLSNVVDDILKKEFPISNYTFILPSKRAGNFLKNEIKSKVHDTILFPKIISIEDFIYELSSIALIDTTSLLFEFYSIYISCIKKEEIESFDSFAKWGTMALQDFNEIDRHLINVTYIFSYLRDINRLDNWSLNSKNDTDLIKKHFSFFERLEVYYTKLYESLQSKKIGYQGIQYREAFENIQNYIENNTDKQLVFIGFNALNKAEESIIKELLEHNLALIYWDVDSYYIKNHPASIFLRKYKKWNYFKDHPFNWEENNLNQEKKIRVIGTPKNITQIKYIGELLSKLNNQNHTYKSTALVLADETLLPAMLSSLPSTVNDINVTMGYELANMSISSLLDIVLKLHMNSKKPGNIFYYKNAIQVLKHPSINTLINTSIIIDHILQNNYIYLGYRSLKNISLGEKDNLQIILFLFENWANDPNLALKNCIKLIELLSNQTDDTLEKEFLYKNLTVINQILHLNTNTPYLKNIKSLHHIYKLIIKNEKLSFQGEPLTGLQLMGMLETRVLDFENVIVSSVNEGILPAGKSDSSFIPFSVKKEVGLPTYQERDAIFSYHFYRLIQRAKNIYLVYNTENDHYGSGEQSRFITELEINKPNSVQKLIVSPKVNTQKSDLNQIIKSKGILQQLEQLAHKGFSPTSLTNYINNPISFYEQKILKIKETENVEETIAANTLGTIVHKTLESLYDPYKGIYLKKDHIITMKKQIQKEIEKWFVEVYKNGDISSGKNLLVYNVAQQFVVNFLNQELKLINDDKKLRVLMLEHDLDTEIHIEGIRFPIKLIGQADRIDELEGTLRIIDYKTGRVSQTDLFIKDWSLIANQYKYSKSFQVLLYALMYTRKYNIDLDTQPVESGVVSFKNITSGFMKVNKRAINKQDMEYFEAQLKQLVVEIFDSTVPFIENKDRYF